jgi:hypothetical protein
MRSQRVLKAALLLSSILLSSIVAVGCAAPSAEEIADGDSEAITLASLENAAVVETGRFRHEGKASGAQDGKHVAAYRFNGFGNTKVKIHVDAKDGAFAPTVALAGPIPGSETKVVVAKRGTRANGVTLEATLEARGAYRLIVGTQSALAGRDGDAGRFDVSFTCVDKCDLPEVTLGEMLRDMKSRQGDAAVRAGLEQLVATRIADADLRGKVLAGLLDVLARGADDKAASPVIPMSMLGVAQGLFEHAPPPRTTAEAPRALTVELSKIGEGCRVTRSKLEPVSPRLPGLSMSDVADYSYDDCALAKLEGLAAAFNALSMQDGSAVLDGKDGKERITSVADLVRALLRKGHRVVLDNARYYADFLGLNYNGASVRASVWMDTGLSLPAGGTLRIPAPNAHHNIWISGPMFDGQLKFYMGVDSGTAFRAQAGVPRAWSGGRVSYTIDAATNEADVLKLLSLAGDLRKKWQTAGASLPMLGYGRLGVCTDSTAILEHAVKGTITLFPLAHPVTDARADAIDRELAALPSDLGTLDSTIPHRDDALRRIEATIPFERVSDVPFPAFREQWAQIRR